MNPIESSDNGNARYLLHCLVQVAVFDKGIGFLWGLKFFALKIFCEEYLQPSLMCQ